MTKDVDADAIEAAVRKVVGVPRPTIVEQFVVESNSSLVVGATTYFNSRNHAVLVTVERIGS